MNGSCLSRCSVAVTSVFLLAAILSVIVLALTGLKFIAFMYMYDVTTGSSSLDDGLSQADLHAVVRPPSSSSSSEEEESVEGAGGSTSDTDKRAPSFRLGKRLSHAKGGYDDVIEEAVDFGDRPEVERRAPSFRLGKRESSELVEHYNHRRSPSFRLGKRLVGAHVYQIFDGEDDRKENIKRAPTFRLGKRRFNDEVSDNDDDHRMTSSLDKRAPSFRLG